MADKEIKIKITANDNASASVGKIRKEFDKLANSAGSKNIKQGIQSISDQLAATKKQFLGFFLGLPALGQITKGFRLAETFKEVNAQLRIAAESQDDFNQSQKRTREIALATGQKLEGITGLYAKLRLNAGLAAEEADKMTGIIAKVTQLDGGGPGADAAIFQLQQGLASGTLRGQELNSVLEQTPSLAKAIADGLETDVGGLRKIAEQGGLTAAVVRDALFKMEEDVNGKFAKLPLTTSRALEKIRTQAIEKLGRLDKQLGITDAFASLLQSVADNIQTIIGVIAGAIAGLSLIFVGAGAGAGRLGLALAGLVSGFGALLTPIGAAAAVLGGLTAFIVANIDKTVDFGDTTATVGEIITAAWAAIKNAVSAAVDAIQSVLGPLVDEILSSFGKVSSQTDGLFKGLMSIINNLVTTVFSAFSLIGKSVGITSASIMQQFRKAFGNVRSLAVAFGRDLANAISGKGISFENTGKALKEGLRDAAAEAGNFGKALSDAYNEEIKFRKDGGVFKAVTDGITTQLKSIKTATDEFKKRGQSGSGAGGQGAGSGRGALKAATDLAQARKSLEDTLFQQVKRLADDQAKREIENTRALFESKSISADEYYQRLDQLQTDLTNREIAELERQKAARQAILDTPNTSEADRLKAMAEIVELTTSQTIAERELNDQRAKVANEIDTLNTARLTSQKEFIDDLQREVFLSGLSNEERETALLLMEAEKRGIQDINKLLELQGQIRENSQAKRRAEEVLRQQNEIFENVQRSVHQAFADGLYKVAKGEGGIREILFTLGDSIMKAMSSSISGQFTDMFFNLFGRQGKDGQSGPAGIFSGMFDGMSAGISDLLSSLKNGLSSIFSSLGGLFSGSGGFFGGLFKSFGFAEGGYTGAGGKHQPAGIVHAGEYVFSAASVRRLGLVALDNLHRLSKGAPVPISHRLGYAEGGLVGDLSLSPAAAPTVNQSVRIVNSIDPRITRDFLASSEGEKVILNVISRNNAALRQALA